MNRWLWRWGPVVAVMALMFWVSGMPNLGPLPADVSDTSAHAAAYAVLGGLVFRALASGHRSGWTLHNAALAWGVAAAYGVTDEFHQAFVPGRTPSGDDWLADAAGAAAAVVVLAALARGRRGEGREV